MQRLSSESVAPETCTWPFGEPWWSNFGYLNTRNSWSKPKKKSTERFFFTSNIDLPIFTEKFPGPPCAHQWGKDGTSSFHNAATAWTPTWTLAEESEAVAKIWVVDHAYGDNKYGIYIYIHMIDIIYIYIISYYKYIYIYVYIYIWCMQLILYHMWVGCYKFL